MKFFMLVNHIGADWKWLQDKKEAKSVVILTLVTFNKLYLGDTSCFLTWHLCDVHVQNECMGQRPKIVRL